MFKVKFAAFCILNAFRLNAIPYILKRNLSFRKKKVWGEVEGKQNQKSNF